VQLTSFLASSVAAVELFSKTICFPLKVYAPFSLPVPIKYLKKSGICVAAACTLGEADIVREMDTKKE